MSKGEEKEARKERSRLLSLLEKEVEGPRYEDLSAHFFSAAGGTRAIAKMLYDEFTAARQGSMIRQRILDMVLRSAKYASEKSPAVDVGMMTDADLEAELEALVGEAETDGDGRGKSE